MNINEMIKADRTPTGMWGRNMNMLKFGKLLKAGQLAALLMALAVTGNAWAQTQVVASDYSVGQNGDVSITLTTTGGEPTLSVFATENPARIVLDMADTTSSVDSNPVSVSTGAVQSFSTLSAGGRTRVLVDLSRSAEFDYTASGNSVTLTVNGSSQAAAPATVAASSNRSASLDSYNVETVDFRRGEEGQSRLGGRRVLIASSYRTLLQQFV